MSDAQIDEAGERWRPGGDVLAARPTVFRDNLLDGQVFLVTGGGTGMGRVMTFLLARLGARVVICGRRETVLQKAREEVAGTVGDMVHAVPMSIGEPDAVERLMDETHSNFGRLDALVNNAGGQFSQDAIDYSHKGWRTVIDLNLNGTWDMMQAAARRWREREAPGSIVSIVAVVSRGLPTPAPPGRA